jgi:hypothetical protein
MANPSKEDAEKAAGKLAGAALKAALSGDTARAERLRQQASQARQLLEGQPNAE